MTISTADYLQELFGLDGLTAVVIGGTGVLGGAFCDALGAAGAHVVVAGRSAERGEARAETIVAGGGSVLVGLGFGFYPGRRAANMNLVDARRTE